MLTVSVQYTFGYPILKYRYPKNQLTNNQSIVRLSVLWILIRIRNFLQDPDPYLEVVDPDSKLDLNLSKNHPKISNLLIMTLKIH
jgi:hypothetical protein